jgi:SAM-dependent methyltransferase
MTDKSTSYEAERRQAFADEVRRGTYNARQLPGDQARHFVVTAFVHSMGEAWSSTAPLSILECGMGTGAWLEAIAGARPAAPLELSGFDLTPEMVELARERLSALASPHVRIGFLRTGDITLAAAYAAEGRAANDTLAGFDVVFCYDVIQQLPPELRLPAIERMLAATRPGGCALIFDKHKYSWHGMTMAARKWVTAHTPIELVPRFYLEVHYPNLKALARRASADFGCVATLLPDRRRRHFALVLRRAENS